MPIQEGFRNQRLTVVPRRVVVEASSRPVTRRLMVTDTGHYPVAADHLMRRPNGIEETVLILCTAGTGMGEHRGRPAPRRVEHGAGGPAGHPHAYGASAHNPWTIWWCHLRGTDLTELIEEIGASAAKPVIPIRRLDRAVAMLDEIVTTLERDHSPASLTGRGGRRLEAADADRGRPRHADAG